ncbi:tetratricopeptide repeat protein [Roseiflexus sp.]
MDEEWPITARTWHIQTLGALRVDAGNGLQPLAREGPRRVLAFLVLNRSAPVSRERLVDALWPEASITQGRRRLADAVYQLRRALPPGALEISGDLLSLRSDLALDFWAFDDLASGSLSSLRAAVTIYTGDLLPEIYDDWVLGPRAAAQERLLNCLERLAEAEAAGDEAAALYRQLIARDPLRETAHVGLMRALVRAGRLPEALKVFSNLERLLDDELGLPPGDTASELAAHLREQIAAARQVHNTVAQRLSRPPFVGRVAERAELLGRLDLARAGHGGIALVVGESGIGKTRLAEEIASAATWQGWQSFWGRCEELAIPPPLAPLSQALAAALPAPRLQQLRRSVASEALALVESLIMPRRPDHWAAGSDEVITIQRLGAALGAVLDGLATIGPLLLILDDVQWAAPDLWPLLEALRLQIAGRPIFLVVLARVPDLQALPDADAILKHWAAQGGILSRLDGLTHSELAELSIGCGVTNLDPEQIARLTADCGGNPLLALTQLAAGGAESVGAQALPDVVRKRVSLLSPPARQAIEVAAVIGTRLTYPVWEAVLTADGMSPETLVAAAGEIERNGLLGLEAQGYRFVHDALRAAVYNALPAAQRQRWHTHILATLSRLAANHPATLLYHAEGANDRAATARYALAVGEQSLSSAGYASARRAFTRALEVLQSDALEEQYAAWRGLVASLEALGEREAQRDATERLAGLAEQMDDDQRRAEAAWRRAEWAWATGQFALAEQRARAGLVIARRQHDPRVGALLHEFAGRCARDLGNYDQAEQDFRAAYAVYARLADQRGMAWIDGMLGLVAQRQGRVQEAIRLQTRAVETFRNAGDPYRELRTLSGLAIALWWAGDYLGARAIFERTMVLSERLGDVRMQEASLHNLGALADLLGDFETAVEIKTRAIDCSRAVNNAMGVAVGLCNLGITFFKLERYAEALSALDEALVIDRATGRRSGEAFCLHSRGQVLVALGRRAEARDAFEAAREIRRALGERDVLLNTEAELALLDLADDCDAALTAVERLLADLRADDRADVREHVQYVASCVYATHGADAQTAAYLRHAAAAMHELLDALPAKVRTSLLQRDPLHRAVQTALAASASLREVRLVRTGVPLGRRLDSADYVTIYWTPVSPEDECFARPEARRRHALRRLLREAAEQGATPTDSDLAQALGVSRRTILRDMAAISGEGEPTPTRRRVSQ